MIKYLLISIALIGGAFALEVYYPITIVQLILLWGALVVGLIAIKKS